MKTYVFGEVLFDVYPQKSVIGGAPFNFAAHLAACGTPCSLISAIGDDTLGKAAMDEMYRLGVDTTHCSTVSYPTGVCRVTMTDGIPNYDLCAQQAYDHIPLSEEALRIIGTEPEKLLYFGTLALRSTDSKETLLQLLHRCSWNEILFDINIRQHYYNQEIVELGLTHCTVLKFSREEAKVFSELGIAQTEYLLPLCKILTHRYPNIHTVLLTLDADGAVVYDAKNDHFTPSEVPHCEVISTVGAGDSFFAGYVSSRLRSIPIKQALNNAVALSSYVVSHLEAVPAYSQKLKEQLSIP